MPTAFAAMRPTAGGKTEHYDPGNAAHSFARRAQIGTEEKAREKGRRDDEREPGQHFEPGRGTRPWCC